MTWFSPPPNELATVVRVATVVGDAAMAAARVVRFALPLST